MRTCPKSKWFWFWMPCHFRIIWSGFRIGTTRLDFFTITKIGWPFEYSEHPKTGPSGIQMVIFWTTFCVWFTNGKGSHFVKNHSKTGLFCPVCHFFVRFANGGTIWKPDRTFLTASLDHFGIKHILFMTLFFIKQSRLATRLFCPVF